MECFGLKYKIVGWWLLLLQGFEDFRWTALQSKRKWGEASFFISCSFIFLGRSRDFLVTSLFIFIFQDDRRIFWWEWCQWRGAFYPFDNFQDLQKVSPFLPFDGYFCFPKWGVFSFSNTTFTRTVLLPMALLVFLFFTQSFSGSNMVSYYTITIFQVWFGQIYLKDFNKPTLSDGKHPSGWEPCLCPCGGTICPRIQVTLQSSF